MTYQTSLDDFDEELNKANSAKIESNKRTVFREFDFRGESTDYATHCFHQYPAIMIGPVARLALKKWFGEKNVILDPFVGSGSVLVESMLLGKRSFGSDLNPLAVMMSKVKTRVLDLDNLKQVEESLANLINSRRNNEHEYELPSEDNLDYWFKPEHFQSLMNIRDIIEKLGVQDEIREFFLLPLSELARDVSLVRNGEFKLYRMKQTDIPSWNPDVYSGYASKVRRNIKGFSHLLENLPENYHVPEVKYGDSRYMDWLEDGSVDGVLTSPPYGDSKTTVAYGQYSFLSSKILGLSEESFRLRQVDDELLGGSRSRSTLTRSDLDSPTLNSVLDRIQREKPKRAKEVLNFYLGYHEVLMEIDRVLAEGGRICYVVGNRTVSGFKIETDLITKELFEQLGMQHLGTAVREIQNKRMPSKNSPTNKRGKVQSTMTQEFLVIMEK